MHAAAERRRAGKICHAVCSHADVKIWNQKSGKNKVFKFWQYATYLKVF